MLPKYPGEGPRDLSRPLERLKILADGRMQGQRLDLALTAVLTWRSRSSIRRMITAGLVKVEGEAVPPARRVRTGETITVHIPIAARARTLETDEELTVVYQDDWMVAVDKPPGVAVHPSGRWLGGTLIETLHRRFRSQGDAHADVVPRLLHRLDVETSGVVAVGLDEEFHATVGRQFEDRLVRKTYLAVVRGHPTQDEGTIDLPIGPDKSSSVRLKLTAGAVRGALPAVTDYRVLRRDGTYSLVEVRPRTGRTHQIRVHMAALGCPLVGDKLYGGDESYFLKQLTGTLTDEHRESLVLDRHALHSHSLTFAHPMLGRELTVTAPLPEDMAALLPGH